MTVDELQMTVDNEIAYSSALPPSAPVFETGDPKEILRTAKIMIVDDEPINVKLVRKYLVMEGYQNFVLTTDSREVMTLVEKEQPDLLLLDVMMPHVSGLDILAAVRASEQFRHLPVIILTAASDQATRRRAIDLGVSDFLGKPVDATELVPRIRNVLIVKQHYDHLQKYSEKLEAEVLRRTAELARSRQEVIHCLARAAEFRDDDTGRHVCRVGRYARLIGEELGWKGEQLEMLEQAAQLHDIGKIGIPDSILLKPGKLAPEEMEIMQKHSAFGKKITQSLPNHEMNVLRGHAELGSKLLQSTDSPILAMAATIAISHHEKFDGTGYPLGLAGEDIPLPGRITAVADVFDALSSKRPYKPPYPAERCFELLREGRGRHFDPQILDAFFNRRPDIIAIQIRFADVD
ncbi:MAG TPA: HD domain-containing phosphohydrolase [Planctomycetaceae bacterium]|jgi:putative two-component system response regulator|nr:HD domain-containing phosphohydrolase [Planctomycetaceae bacterium]